MAPRNLMILFFSTVAVSLVILIIFFSLFFKNVDLSFDTKMPDAAPDLSNFYKNEKPSSTKGDGVGGATIRVPQDEQPKAPAALSKETSGVGDEDLDVVDQESPAGTSSSDDASGDANRRGPSRGLDSSHGSDSAIPPVPGGGNGSAPTPAAEPKVPPAPPKPKPVRIDPEAGQVTPKPEPRHSTPASPPPANPAPADHTGSVPKPQGNYQVYLDGFGSKEAAQAKSEELKASGQTPYVKNVGGKYVVQLGVFSTKDSAQGVAAQAGAKLRQLN